MSSPNRSTSDIEDAFSSMNILNYTSVSSDYFPALSESSSFNSLEDSKDNMIQPVFSPFYNNPYLKNVQAFYAKELPISSPDPITPPLFNSISRGFCGMLHGLVINWSSSAIETSHNRVNGIQFETNDARRSG
ncbi:hypothetical protein Tco_1505109 [Tanacetum coccineum]